MGVGPALRGQHLDVAAVVDRLFGKQRPLDQVDEMGADVVQPFALLRVVEEPRRPDVRRTRHQLQQVMDALHVHRGIVLGPLQHLAEHRRIVDERALQDRRHLEALGHDVVGDDAGAIGLGEGAFQLVEIRRLEDPRLVRQHVQAGLDRCRDPIDLRAVAARKHDDVARPVAQHPLEGVRRRVHVDGPCRRARGAPVERVDSLEVFVEIGPERRVDVDAGRDTRVHLLLHERGVEMAGIDGHQTDIGHGRGSSPGVWRRHPAPAPRQRR